MRRIYLFIYATYLVILVSGVSVAHSQNFCAFDKITSTINNKYPAIAQNIAENERKLNQIITQKRTQPQAATREMSIYTIPVVVHVLHTGDDIGTVFNPDTTQIIEAINYLNDVYSGTNALLTPAGTDAAGDIGIRFALAQRDPGCNPTNGIHRVDMSNDWSYVANGAIYDDIGADIALKTPIIWDKSRYYNIYVVNKINGNVGGEAGVGGYAYLPINSVIDGTVILASEMKAGSKTLVHEIGHAFNLYHPFEGSSLNTECPSGYNDRVADTDPISFNIDEFGTIDFLCRTGVNKCNNNLPYNIRTENNFMNYTACYTLFTPGQRERMRASLLLLDRISLIASTAAIPTNQLPACSPKVNFENDFAELERVAYSTTGCRSYKDYLVYLNIASNPSTNLNAEIQVDPASDAVENTDYLFPSGKTVSFPAGSNNMQPLKIRVFSNENSDKPRTLKLGFSMGNKDDTLKGTACIEMNIRLLPLNTQPIPVGSLAASQVGRRDENITGVNIFNGTVNSQKTQLLYKAYELRKAGITAGNITGLHLFILKNTTQAFKTINIKIGHTAFKELVNNGNINAINNAIQVASYGSFSTAYGWNSFKFNTPFKWNGTDNIVVELCINNNAGADFGVDDVYAYSDTGSVDRGNTIYALNEGCEGPLNSISYYSKGIRPVIKFDHIKAGNPVEDTIAISSTEYLGPFAEIYFYDKSSQKRIIAKIKNLTDWNYGCTNIRIDRFGTNATPFWNNIKSQFLAQKTYIITPERNNPHGKYELTLFYTNAEKTGFESVSGVKWEDVKVIKAEVPINSITPTNPQTNKVQITPVSNLSTFGTAYAITAGFSTGFSAFGVGLATVSAALPVEWGKIQASVQGENVLIKWKTLAELNNDYFEVEKSIDGIYFETIGKVNAQGIGSTISQYQFIHLHPAYNGKLYYRIKQVDKDGGYSYSPITYITIYSANPKPSIYPVPATQYITIDFGKEVLQPLIEIYSVDMKLVDSRKKAGRTLKESINIQHLNAGAYIVRVSYEGKTYSLRFVKL